MVKSIFHDLGVNYEVNDHHVNFRVGNSSNEKARPMVVKLGHASAKYEILKNAKKLKGMASWMGVSITHDLTKNEYFEEKVREQNLRHYAEKMNQNLSIVDKQSKIWKVVGGRGDRRVKCFFL